MTKKSFVGSNVTVIYMWLILCWSWPILGGNAWNLYRSMPTRSRHCFPGERAFLKFKIMCGSAWDGRFFRRSFGIGLCGLGMLWVWGWLWDNRCQLRVQPGCQMSDVSHELLLAARCQMPAASVFAPAIYLWNRLWTGKPLTLSTHLVWNRLWIEKPATEFAATKWPWDLAPCEKTGVGPPGHWVPNSNHLLYCHCVSQPKPWCKYGYSWGMCVNCLQQILVIYAYTPSKIDHISMGVHCFICVRRPHKSRAWSLVIEDDWLILHHHCVYCGHLSLYL